MGKRTLEQDVWLNPQDLGFGEDSYISTKTSEDRYHTVPAKLVYDVDEPTVRVHMTNKEFDEAFDEAYSGMDTDVASVKEKIKKKLFKGRL
jgi:hypothetical protein